MSVANHRLGPDARNTCRAHGPVRRALPPASVALCQTGARALDRRRPGGGSRVQPRPGDPAGPEVDGRRPRGGPRSGRSVAGGALPAAAGHRRGRAVRPAPMAGGPAARGGGGVDARRPLPPSAAAAGGVPRPLALGAVALTRYHRSDAAADVPGLPADVPAGQRHDDFGRFRHPVRAGVVAGAGAARARRPADGPVLALRDEVLAGGAQGPGPGRRPDDGRRGERAGHPHRQGVRPQPQPGARLPGARAAAAHHGTGQGPAARRDLGARHRHSGAGDRRRAGARHDRGGRRHPVGGHARGVPLDGAGAALAGRLDRLPARDEPGGGDGGRSLLRGHGRRGGAGARDVRDGVRDAGPGHRLRRGRVPVPGRRARVTSRPRPDRPADPARRDDGAGGRHGFRQDDPDGSRAPAARRHGRPDPAGRRGHLHHAAPAAARAGVGGLRGAHPLLGDRRGERADGRGGSERTGAAPGPVRRAGRLRAPAAAGRRHPGRRAGAEPLRRPAAAPRAGPRRGRGPAVPGARRPALRAGRAHRGTGGGGAAARTGGDDGSGRRPPAVHGDAGGPGGPVVRRPDQRRRHPSGAPAHQPRIRLADVGCPRHRCSRPRGGWRPMTSTTADGPALADEDLPGKGSGPARDAGDPFGADTLPAPRGATRALLVSLLTPMRARVAVTSLLLLLQQAAVQAGPLLVAYAIDRGVPAFRDHDYGPLAAVGIGYAVCAVGAGVLQYAFIRAAARINQDVLLDLRGRIFRHAQALSVDFHERYTSGRLISRSTTDVESLQELLSEGLQELIGVVLSFVYISAMLLWLDFGLGAVAVASFVPLYLLVRLYQRRAAVIFAGRSTAIAAVIVKFAETMNGIRPVQAFRRERANDRDFAVSNHDHERRNGDALLEMARYVVGSRLVANTAVAAMVLWGAYRVASGTLALGVLAAAVLYLRRLYDPIDRLAMFLNSYQSASASLEKIAGLLAQTPAVPEPAEPKALPPVAGEHPGREVTFDGVRFAYRTGGEVLPRFGLTIPAGQTVAVVGSTG